MTGDLVSRLLSAIQEREDRAKAVTAGNGGMGLLDSWHTRACGYGQSEFAEPCDCDVPDQLLRLCQAHRKIIDDYQRLLKASRETRDLAQSGAALALLGALRALAEGYGIEAES